VRVAIINHLGDVGAGAENALLQFLVCLPESIEPVFFLFEDGAFAQAMRERFGTVTVLQMSERVATVKRTGLSLSAVPDSIELVGRLTRALRAAEPHMVLTNSMKAHIIGSIAAKVAGIPCVNYVHDYLTGSALALLKIVSRMCAVERMTCSKDVSANLGIAHTTAVYSAIDTAAFRHLPERQAARSALGLPEDRLQVVALVGRIARWKGQDRFIRIAIDVIRDIDVHFAIIGSPLFGCDPEYMSELTAAVSSAGLQKRIHFVPWQSDMRNVYAAIDLACNCSTREPFARTSLEALVNGIPLICFDDAGVCEILDKQHCGTHVPAGDEVAFARAIRAYLTYSQLMTDATSGARSAVEPFISGAFASFNDVIRRVAV
jgi:glycosyltransferase involved in cell wall biosynthesis